MLENSYVNHHVMQLSFVVFSIKGGFFSRLNLVKENFFRVFGWIIDQ